MACNLLPLSRAVAKSKNSDTTSEASESGTTTSGWASRWDSREDLRDLVSKLGLKDVSELHQERFRVDRCKLERMLTGDNDATFPADVFFAKVMEDTDTVITWPNKLKIGAKSKKDPHVRIAGKPEDVQAAKDRILTVLNTRCNRVTMKIDVSYTDHSHIIGKGGMSIKRVMEETRCHVHFPDSNRSNSNEKSNQVSISGDIEGVELARSRVRELIPLIFGFELPIMSKNVDVNSPYVIKIQEQYKVQVMFKTRPKLHATLVLVKGVEWEVHHVKQATLMLMEYMCDNLANQIPVQMSMEISPHHHPTVLGKNHGNLKAIIHHTNCQIMFPDAQDPNIPNLKKSNVTITGNIHNIYKARQLLMGSLPLIVIFDLPDDQDELKIKPEQISGIQTTYDVSINVRQKANKTTKACVIKGIERQASNIYKARNVILGIEEPPVHADIPLTYQIPNQSSSPIQQKLELPAPSNVIAPSLSSPLISPTWYYPSPAVPQQQCPPFVGMHQQQHFFPPNLNFNTIPHQNMASNSTGYQSMKSTHLEQTLTADQANLSACSSLSTISSRSNPRNSLSPSGYASYGDSPNKSGYTGAYGQNQPTELSTALSEMNNPGAYHGPTLDKKPQSSPGGMAYYDYESKRMAALRAMRSKPQAGTMRVPHNSWSGYGVSNTSPGAFLSDKYKREDEMWHLNSPRPNEMPILQPANPVMNTSNLLDPTPSHVWHRVSTNSWQDLPSMLTAMKLDHYVQLFKEHEIDLTIFSTLTDQDLVDIGITAFGARRRILLAISEINKRNLPFSAAPGAERRNSGSSPNGGAGNSRHPSW
ncbi:protein bicaudal C [Euwallacea fornicatus]|uniref:protein bicaudal C n=1 Tax=Euwallacea fornicatus TaxID=995702 RepID=UPI00338E22FA